MRLTKSRKSAFNKGFAAASRLSRAAGRIGRIEPTIYNSQGMLETNVILAGDCIATMKAAPAGSVDLVFADPPFNIGYLYHGYKDERNDADYFAFSKEWMRAVKRVLKPTGSFFLAIGDEYAADLAVIARRQLGFNLRNWIIWHYTFGQQPKAKFARSHTHILYFTMDEKEFTFNADAIRVASARQTTYADARANPKGKLPDDVWYLRPQEANAAEEQLFSDESDTWNVSRVCGTFKEREGWHGCQMPIGVLDRVIKVASNPGDVVLDPFNGSGTTVVSAARLGRKYIGIDQSAEYVEFARKRLEATLAAGDSALTDINRASRVVTATDAFGRKRTPRGKAKKSA